MTGQNVAVNNLASLMVWKIYQEYQYCLGKKDHWEAKLQQMAKIYQILMAIILLLTIVLAYWLANVPYKPVVVISMLAAAAVGGISALWAKEKMNHYQLQIKDVDSGVVEFIKNRISKILLAHTCFTHDDMDAIVNFYCDQIHVVVDNFFQTNFTSPLTAEEEEEIKSWLKTSWSSFITSP